MQDIPQNRTLEWADPMSSGGFSIPGGEAGVLKVVSWNSQSDQIRLDYEDIDANAFLPKGCEIILVISVTSQHASPIYAICHLNTEWDYGYDFKLVEVVYELPNITDYQQSASHKGGSQS